MKKALRTQLGKQLRALTSEQLDVQSTRTACALRELSEYKNAKNIAFYMHMDSCELRTDKMIKNAFDDGKCVYLPHIIKYTSEEEHPWYPDQQTHLRMFQMPTLESVESLSPRGKYKLKEPTEGINCLDIDGLDLIVVPGVGFTRNLGRLGHGAGFYDSFFNEHRYTFNRDPKLVGVGLDVQLVDEVPLDPHDRRLDAVIIDGTVYK